MKKAIIILSVLMIVLSLAACGGSSDKAKLVGEYSDYYKGYNPAFFSGQRYYSYHNDRISFFNDNTFCFRTIGEFGTQYDDPPLGLDIEKEWDYAVSGTYKIKKGFITLQYDESTDIDSQMNFEKQIPYYINEYTKELIFDVNNEGKSDWSKVSDTPSKYENKNLLIR